MFGTTSLLLLNHLNLPPHLPHLLLLPLRVAEIQCLVEEEHGALFAYSSVADISKNGRVVSHMHVIVLVRVDNDVSSVVAQILVVIGRGRGHVILW